MFRLSWEWNVQGVVHELDPKKMGIWLWPGDKTLYRFLVSWRCLLSRKVWWAVCVGSFWQKLRYFTDQNGPNGDHMKMNFEQKSEKREFKREKVGKIRWQSEVICLFSMFRSCVLVFKLSIKCIFCNSVLTSAWNLSLLKQFTCMNLKGLVTHFYKLVLFILLWLTVSEMKLKNFRGISAEPASFLIF